ncbi:hypothetical protein, partial [Paenibacillus algorifonticola]|uniref:hypothetical protein n=1 Tax=Paenibacillus algorifonticola TaxID=684063 RepID=UPI001E501AB5
YLEKLFSEYSLLMFAKGLCNASDHTIEKQKSILHIEFFPDKNNRFSDLISRFRAVFYRPSHFSI